MPAPVIGGIIAAAGAVGSAAIGAHTAHEAANQQQQASDKAMGLAQQQYQQGQQYLAPYVSGQATAALRTPVSGAGGYTPGVGLTSGPSMTVGRLSAYGGAPQTFGAPTIGARRTFPNGKTGIWDGRGWMEQ